MARSATASSECCCSRCGASFYRDVNQIRSTNYCSQYCKNAINRERRRARGIKQSRNQGTIEAPCYACAKLIRRSPSAFRGRIFCSRKCAAEGRRGAGNSQWLGKSRDAICAQCGHSFRRKFSGLDWRNPAKFCSTRCAGLAKDKGEARRREVKRRLWRRRAYRERAVGTLGHHTEDEWLDILRFYENKCAHCEASDRALTRDHIIPLSKGGDDLIDNIRPLCQSCNSKRWNKMRVLAFDLGMNVGWGSLESGKIPQAGSFIIERDIRDLGAIAMDFEERACEIIARQKPDVIARASCITNRKSLPQNIAPYYGLSMKLDEMARRRRLRCIERDESDCRKAFLEFVPRRSAAIKRAVIAGCMQRGWWAANDHGCDALCVGARILELLDDTRSHETTPLFVKRKTDVRKHA